jgi:hypothetical protein
MVPIFAKHNIPQRSIFVFIQPKRGRGLSVRRTKITLHAGTSSAAGVKTTYCKQSRRATFDQLLASSPGAGADRDIQKKPWQRLCIPGDLN